MINLNSARNKAKTAAVLATVSQLITPISVCLDGGNGLNYSEMGAVGAAGGQMCNNSSDTQTVPTNWPAISPSYVWNTLPRASDASAFTFNFMANSSPAGLQKIKCTQAGCLAL